MEIQNIPTSSYKDQKPGTSGLRKPTKFFTDKKYYTENFIFAILSTINENDSTLVVGGDGRYYMKQAIQIIIKLAASTKSIKKLIIAQNGILSTPAASNLIIKNKAIGGILLTASHNPGGPDNDFGIKYNTANGGPASSKVTDEIFEISKNISSFTSCENIEIDISEIQSKSFEIKVENMTKSFEIEIVDSVADYEKMCESIFNFDKIRELFKNGFKIRLDCMHGVIGPYCERIIKNSLNANIDSIVNYIPHETFNNGHPDPNLIYAKNLVDFMEDEKNSDFEFAAAFDGDGDRNMVLGKKGFFITPSDSLAVIAEHANNCIPYFQKIGGIKGIARSMPTSAACDLVALALGVKCYQVPTGWKYFGALMDNGDISLCGEESFGTGSTHIREKDGLWAVLAWLQILANKLNLSAQGLVQDHWKTFGRHYYCRWDYENLKSEQGSKIMSKLTDFSKNPLNCLENFKNNVNLANLSLQSIESFSYTDLDGTVASNQGIIMKFQKNGIYYGRAIVRLSGTGSSGATIRLYLERYEKEMLDLESNEAVSELQIAANEIAQISVIGEREKPSVIT